MKSNTKTCFEIDILNTIPKRGKHCQNSNNQVRKLTQKTLDMHSFNLKIITGKEKLYFEKARAILKNSGKR